MPFQSSDGKNWSSAKPKPRSAVDDIFKRAEQKLAAQAKDGQVRHQVFLAVLLHTLLVFVSGLILSTPIIFLADIAFGEARQHNLDTLAYNWGASSKLENGRFSIFLMLIVGGSAVTAITAAVRRARLLSASVKEIHQEKQQQKIRVRLNNGTTGTIDEEDFDAATMERL